MSIFELICNSCGKLSPTTSRRCDSSQNPPWLQHKHNYHARMPESLYRPSREQKPAPTRRFETQTVAGAQEITQLECPGFGILFSACRMPAERLILATGSS